MNFKSTLAIALLTSLSSIALAQGTFNTNDVSTNTNPSNTRANSADLTREQLKKEQKKSWHFSYNGSIGYGSWEDPNGDKADNSTPITLGVSVQKGGFYAGLLGDHEDSELDTYMDTGYVYKMSKSILLAGNYEHWSSSDDSHDTDNSLSIAAAWNGLGLNYYRELGNDPIKAYGAFYMKKFNKSFVGLGAEEQDGQDMVGYILEYDYNFIQDYRAGVSYELDKKKGSPDASTWYVTLSKGLDFNGILDAMRQYM
jgi:hypothetical protein